DPEAGARPRLVRLGEQLLREGLAARVLGKQLRAAAQHQEEVRPRWPLRRPPRSGQRGLERRRDDPRRESLKRKHTTSSHLTRFRRSVVTPRLLSRDPGTESGAVLRTMRLQRWPTTGEAKPGTAST